MYKYILQYMRVPYGYMSRMEMYYNEVNDNHCLMFILCHLNRSGYPTKTNEYMLTLVRAYGKKNVLA